MNRRSLALALLAIPVLLAPAVALHVSPPRTLQLVDAAGRPVAEAWVAYHFVGRRFAVVQTNTWERAGEVLRPDEDGEVELGWRVHARCCWPLQTGPDRVLSLVYAPRQHNATGPLGTSGREGRVTFDGDRMTITDLAGDPGAWSETVRQLYGFVVQDLLLDVDGPWAAVRPEISADLANAVAAEYLGFQRLWAAAPRQRPEAPPHLQYAGEAERRAWEAAIAVRLAREPSWGPYMARLFEDDVRYLRAKVADHVAARATAAP